MAAMTLGHFLRSEGHAKLASMGMMLGGILNMFLDPVFIYGFGMGVTGAAVATALSNLISMMFFLVCFKRLEGKTVLSLSLSHFRMRYANQVFSVGIASALTTGLANLSNMTIVKLASGYGDISVVVYGIVKKIDMFPLGISMGLCQGFMPLVGYNYASGNYGRMREAAVFSWKIAMVIALWLSWVCAVDSWGVYPRASDQFSWGPVFKDCLPCRAFDSCKRADYLYLAGYGKRGSGHGADSLQTGAVKCPAADCDESGIRALRHDLDPACD